MKESTAIPDEVYEEATLDAAVRFLYERGVTPEQYKEYWESEYGREYAYSEMQAHKAEMVQDIINETEVNDVE